MFGPNGNIYYVSSDDGFITIKTLMIQLTNELMFFYLKMIFLGNNMIYLGYFFFSIGEGAFCLIVISIILTKMVDIVSVFTCR